MEVLHFCGPCFSLYHGNSTFLFVFLRLISKQMGRISCEGDLKLNLRWDCQKFFVTHRNSFFLAWPSVVYSNHVGKSQRIIRTPLKPRLDLFYLSKFIQPFLWKLPKEVNPQASVMRSCWSVVSENGSSGRKSKSRSGPASVTTGWECPPGLMPAQARCRSSGGEGKRPTAVPRGQSRKERQGSKVISHRLLGR